MARISFSPLVEEIVGKLAGSVFQDSYGGFQIRTRVSPRNPQSTYQQLRRGQFAFLSASWRGLTSIQRQTFIDNAASPGAALNLFLQANVNLTLIEEPIITTYVPGSVPDPLQIDIITANNNVFIIQASGAITTVPAGTKLLIQVTMRKPATKIFTNPSQYSPVISYDAGTDLSVTQNIITEWQARYGQMQATGILALKASLIDKTQGLRGPESFSNAAIATGTAEVGFDVPAVVGGFNCAAGTRLFVFPDAFVGVGFAYYYDPALTVPVTGFSNFTSPVPSSTVFNCNPVTGIGTSLAGICV